MQYAICSVSAAPLRKEPSHRSEMTSQLLFGEGLRILGSEKEWCQVQGTFDGYEGWVTVHQITEAAQQDAKEPAEWVTSGFLNQLEKDGTAIPVPMGCSLPSFDEGSKKLWNGFLLKGGCRNTKIPGSIDELMALTKAWLHAPYLWGGRTFMGVDCSGFVQTVFRVIGVPLLRDAYQQAGQGTVVPQLEGARTGDVAFFHNEAGKIIHVGILRSPDSIIHASGTVRIDTLTSEGIMHSSTGKQTHQLHSVKRMTEQVGS